MLQDRITALGGYFKGIESYNQALIVKVTYPERWAYYNSDDNKIKVAKSEDSANEYYYYGDSQEIDLDKIFDLIEQTIKMNQSVLKKVALLKDKISELKELFDIHPLETLQTLEFTFKPKEEMPKPKRKYTRHIKPVEKDEETPKEIVENKNNADTEVVAVKTVDE